jgi:ABC-type transport system involved in cytochrome bd biosynthesis fused ATPase/permease subunit
VINPRLLKINKRSNGYIVCIFIFNIAILLTNVYILSNLSEFFSKLVLGTLVHIDLLIMVLKISLTIVVRLIFVRFATMLTYRASSEIKIKLRELVFLELLKTKRYEEVSLGSSELVQLAGEGIEQLEIYYGRYLPQLLYSLSAPLILFAILIKIDLVVAIALLIAVPLIPISIVVVQRIAKRLLGNYWRAYTSLGDLFLDNLQNLTTMKIYRSAVHYLEKMDEEAERFRKATMRVLIMQLNSIVVMDLVAYLGASIGIILGLMAYQNGRITITQTLFIILISADFFIPMRQLGSLFHVALNGMAASRRLFAFFDQPKIVDGGKTLSSIREISFKHVYFKYPSTKEYVLYDIDFSLPTNGLVVVVGESGVGKSTLASCLNRIYYVNKGEIQINGVNINEYSQSSLAKNIVSLSNLSYVFAGTVKENLQLGNIELGEEEIMIALETVDLSDFVKMHGGLAMRLEENGNNLSTGQRQRLLFARSLLKDSSVMILDEVTSNIDIESEHLIMKQVKRLSSKKLILMISHRLYHATIADEVIFFTKGNVVSIANHEQLISENIRYRELFIAQQDLESNLKVKHA